MREALESFFRNPSASCGQITNERALQLELGLHLRSSGLRVDFEKSMRAPRLPGSTLKPKHNLDLLVRRPDERIGIELKVPLNGRHPETMYAFMADIEFLEAIRRTAQIDRGFAIMLTPDRAFWKDSGRGSPIHNLFRQTESVVTAKIDKPTGARDTSIVLEGSYQIAHQWLDCGDVLARAKTVIVEV